MSAGGVKSTGLHPVGTIARVLDVSERKVQQLAREGIIPKAKHGQYELIGCVQGYIRHLRAVKAGHESEDGKLDLVAERARLDAARADAQEMRNEEMRGELIPRQVLEPAFQSVLAAFRTSLRALHVRLREEVPEIGRAGAQLIRRLHDEALSEMANALEALGARRSASRKRSDSAASAESDAEPVG